MIGFRDLYPAQGPSDIPVPDTPEQQVKEPSLVDGGVRPDSVQWRNEYVTVAEAADWMRVNPMTVYRMIKRQELAATRVGRQFRIHKNAVQAVLTPKEF